MKTALLKTGALILYDKAVAIAGDSPTYQFSRGKLGIVAIVPASQIQSLEAQPTDASNTVAQIEQPNPWGSGLPTMTHGSARPRNPGAPPEEPPEP
jgi:hypothetical protein